MQQIKVQRGIVCACRCADWLMGLLGPLSKHGKRSKNTRAPPTSIIFQLLLVHVDNVGTHAVEEILRHMGSGNRDSGARPNP